jgi:PIN domain nuclease of toxin-antitoxin system
MGSTNRTSSSLIRNSFSSSLLSTKIVVPGCGTLTMQRQHASSSQRTGTTHRDQTTRALAAWSPETGPLLSRDQQENPIGVRQTRKVAWPSVRTSTSTLRSYRGSAAQNFS